MFVKTVKIKSAVKVLATVAAICALLALGLGLVNYFGLGGSRIELPNEVSQKEFLESLGWEVSAIPLEAREVTVPLEWTSVYEEYNGLQKQQGFDLTRYKGDTVKVTTWLILNYEGNPDVVATLMTKDGVLIAGDIQSMELGGFMHGLSPISE